MNNDKNIKYIAITGAAGNVSYSLLFRIANGDLFGNNQLVFFNLLDLKEKKNILNGIVMELEDCAFPLFCGAIIYYNPEIAFKNSDIVIFLGAHPRSIGMNRRDLLLLNSKIFMEYGKSLNKVLNKNIKLVVVGNPTNTNTYVLMKFCPNIPRENFTAVLRLDYNRAISKLSIKSKINLKLIKNVIVWGNHSNTMYPDFRFSMIFDRIYLKDIINDEKWNKDVFIPFIRNRGSDLINIRNKSSAASAANAVIDHIRDWINGSGNKWVTMGVPSNGLYNVPLDIIFGMPVICKDGKYEIVKNIKFDSFSKKQIFKSIDELIEEKNIVQDFLNMNI